MSNVTEPGNPLYDCFGLNKSLFLLINKIHAPVLDQVMLSVTWLGHPRLYPFYMAALLLLSWRKPGIMPLRNLVVFTVSYVATSLIIVPTLKAALDFPRPSTIFGAQAITILGNPDRFHSFPSGHSAFAVLMAASLLPDIPRGGKLLLLLFALLVCISRISAGAHFPADVIGGATISILVVLAVRSAIGRPTTQWNRRL
ncbi:MAG: PAP2 family protein [Nitrosomonadales bacterium]|nr:MAG: PAP2 family protein [Nitrosomonadales bacterium]